jgi:cold shock CspA family protein
MQEPAKIEFQGFEPEERFRREISERVAALESRFGRITSCRVAVRATNGRHRVGNLYHVSIQLALPNGREVNVGRTPSADERHGDLQFAINDAFKRARRRLQDNVRLMQTQVKTHEEQPIGTVTQLDPVNEVGIIETSDGREIYFHPNAVLNGGFAKLEVGSRVTFHEEMGVKGPQASTVRLLGKHGLR